MDERGFQIQELHVVIVQLHQRADSEHTTTDKTEQPTAECGTCYKRHIYDVTDSEASWQRGRDDCQNILAQREQGKGRINTCNVWKYMSIPKEIFCRKLHHCRPH